MNELVTWLRAQLDEDERVAQAATPGPWRIHPERENVILEPWPIDSVGARHDPARVLREVEAKRAIVDEHGPRKVASVDRDTWGQGFVICRRCRLDARQVVSPCPTLRLLASVYADRPGYREEWRP